MSIQETAQRPLRSSSRSGKTWIVLAAAAGVLALAVVGSGVGWAIHRATIKHPSDMTFAGPVRLAIVDVLDGDVTVENAAGPVRLHSTARYIFSKPHVHAGLRRGVLTVRTNCGAVQLQVCSTNLRLSVPRGTAVDIHTRSGRISTTDVSAARIRAEATGTVSLHLTNDPSLIVAHSHSRDVNVWLPRAPYVVDASARYDRTYVHIPRDDSAPRTIEATADRGIVKIKAR